MHHRITTALFALLMISLLAGCQIGAAPLSQSQLKEYLRDQQITPLVVEEVGGVVTVVLWKDTRKLGCYVAWARNGIEAAQKTDYLNGSQQGNTLQPITAIYDSAFNNDIVCLTINDQRLRQQARILKLRFANNSEMSLQIQNQGDMIIGHPSKISSSRVDLIIYDAGNSELARLTF